MKWLRFSALAAVLPALLLFGGLAGSGGSRNLAASPQEGLEILSGRQRQRVEARTEGGAVYYRLRDVANPLGLQFREERDRLTLSGPRGTLVLLDGRRLVSYGDLDLLLSAAPWKRRNRDWYVPEDFIARALPYVLAGKLERVGDRRYRVEALAENRVEVRVTNYPDHVTLVFLPSEKAPAVVNDYEDFIQVAFEGVLVRPILPQNQPERGIVSALEFNDNDPFGSFRIYKGSRFHNFREFSLTDPDRKVIDLYGPPEASPPTRVEVEFGPSLSAPAAAPDPPPAAPGPADDPRGPLTRHFRSDVTIDAGHGGEDYGVNPVPEAPEKNVSLRIAARLEELLRERGVRPALTRVRDLDLPLEQRSGMANQHHSRVYISLHTGGAPSSLTRGPVVYVHRQVWPREGAGGSDSAGNPVEAGPYASAAGELALVPWGEAQQPYLARSRALAELVQRELNQLFGTQNRVVEVPLAVLAPVRAPAIVVEVGFLTNSEDRARLSAPDFQERIARVLAIALEKFLR